VAEDLIHHRNIQIVLEGACWFADFSNSRKLIAFSGTKKASIFNAKRLKTLNLTSLMFKVLFRSAQ
jgi:hypothetical protein